MQKQPRWQMQLRYWFDNLFSLGTPGLVAWLGLLSLAIIFLTTLIITLYGLAPAGEEPYNFPEAFWLAFRGVMGATGTGNRGTMWTYRILMLAVSLFGIFIFSTLIGLLNTGIQARIQNLRKGRSIVMEKNHTVILGWTEQVFQILEELMRANASEKRACVVILSENPKVMMEDEIHRRIKHTGKTRVVCRTGNPMDMTDLNIANLNSAKNILVLTPETQNPDADVIKTVLAITNHPDRRTEPYHIVACIRNPKNYDIATEIGKTEVGWIRSGDVISRIVAQTCRQSGLSAVITELLDFSGNEIYFHEEPTLVGKTFADAVLFFSNSSVIGLLSKPDQKVTLQPALNARLKPGDHVVVIAADNDAIALSAHQENLHLAPESQDLAVSSDPTEHTLVLGWNWRGPIILGELDYYVAPGSDALVVAEKEGIEMEIERGCRGHMNLRVCFRSGDVTDRQFLESLELGQFNHIILLAYSDRLSPQQADALTLMTLIHLRDIADKQGFHFSIVTEMLDVRNRALVVAARADDFIVSDRLISLMMVQIAENSTLNQVFTDLFKSSGSEIYLKPASRYVAVGEPVDFYWVVKEGLQYNEIAIGYRLASQARDPGKSFGVVLNPLKDEKIIFKPQDSIIVVASS